MGLQLDDGRGGSWVEGRVPTLSKGVWPITAYRNAGLAGSGEPTLKGSWKYAHFFGFSYFLIVIN